MLNNIPMGAHLGNSGHGIQIQTTWLQTSFWNQHILLLLMSKSVDEWMRVVT